MSQKPNLNTSQNLPFYEKKYHLKMSIGHVPFELCVIKDYDKSLNKIWYVEYKIFDEKKQELVRRRVTLRHETAAKRYAYAKNVIKDIDALLKKGATINHVDRPDVSKKIFSNTSLLDAAKYFLDFNTSILEPQTIAGYKRDLKRFTDYIGNKNIKNKTISNFTNPEAYAFLDYLSIEKKISNRSRNNNKNTLVTFFNFYISRKVITANPFFEIKKLPQIASKHAAYSELQKKKYLEICATNNETMLKLFVTFIYFTFLRPWRELLLLKIGDIKDATIRVAAENAKDKTTEHVMIPAAFNKIIDEYGLRSKPENHYVFGREDNPKLPLDRKHIYRKHLKILTEMGIEDQKYDMYSWKHTGVITLFMATQNIELIRQQCRHSDIATTQKYLRDLGLFMDYTQIDKFPEF